VILYFSGANQHNTGIEFLSQEETEANDLIPTSRPRRKVLEDTRGLHKASHGNPLPGGADQP
jgi:hypothetical protein